MESSTQPWSIDVCDSYNDNTTTSLTDGSMPNCPSSDDSDTALGDDMSEKSTTSIFSVSDGEVIDDEQLFSVCSTDEKSNSGTENQFEAYLRSVSGMDKDRSNRLDKAGELNRVTESVSTVDSESEFEVLTVRRSTSLKTYKTPPGSPHPKKEVRFADALGLDLESIRHIMNTSEPPIVPASAIRHLRVNCGGLDSLVPTRRRILHPCFPQPGMSPNFAARVDERHVALHSFRADYDVLSGTVCVSNIAFEKRVTVRYSFDSWMTFTDVTATYVDGSNTGSTDLFRFSIVLPESCGAEYTFIEFSIMYMAGAGSEVYWDSNFGSNYRVDCYFN